MTTKRRIAVSLACVWMALLAAACNRDNPPPQFPQALGEGTARRLPIRLARADKSILGAAASGEGTTPKPEAGGASSGAGEPVTIDDSTAEAAARSVLAVVKAGRLADLERLLVADQQDAFRQFMAAAQPLLDASAELQRAAAEKFAGHAVQIPLPIMAVGALGEARIVGVTIADNQQEADATLDIPNVGQQQVKLRQAEGKWRVELPNAAALAAVGTQADAINKIANDLMAVTARINDGQIADAAALEAALKTVMTGGGAPASPESTAQPTDQPPPSNEPPPANTARPAPRQRDEVDQVYSGPGQLRAR